jgi:transposase-like protein
VRWYLRYKFSFRDLVEMKAEHGLSLAHATMMRRIQRYVPKFEKRWASLARLDGPGASTKPMSKSRGTGPISTARLTKRVKTVDFLLRAKPAAAKAFLRRAFRDQGRLPHKITLDGYQASHHEA